MHRQRCVTVASGRVVTLGQYVAAVKLAKANPDTEFRQGCGRSGRARGPKSSASSPRGWSTG